MLSGMLIGFGIAFWILGYIKVGFYDDKGYEIKRAFLRPPTIVYLLCGLPKAKNIPSGVMALLALIMQLQALLYIGYGIVYLFWGNPNIALHGFLLFLCATFIFVFCWVLYKKNPYVIENDTKSHYD